MAACHNARVVESKVLAPWPIISGDCTRVLFPVCRAPLPAQPVCPLSISEPVNDVPMKHGDIIIQQLVDNQPLYG